MKTRFAICVLLAILGISESKAQVGVSVQLGCAPSWAPYNCGDARFYFIPDIDMYYDVWYGNYWYFDCGRWVCAPRLPRRYAYFDFYNCYKVVLDYRGNQPYRFYNDHRVAYSRYRDYRGPRQYTIRDRGMVARPGSTRPERYDHSDRYDHHGDYRRDEYRGDRFERGDRYEQGRNGGRDEREIRSTRPSQERGVRDDRGARGERGGRPNGGGGGRSGGHHGR